MLRIHHPLPSRDRRRFRPQTGTDIRAEPGGAEFSVSSWGQPKTLWVCQGEDRTGHTRRGRGCKELRQNATATVSYPGATEDAVVAMSALLSLADWLRRKRSSQGEQPCSADVKDQSPPARG